MSSSSSLYSLSYTITKRKHGNTTSSSSSSPTRKRQRTVMISASAASLYLSRVQQQQQQPQPQQQQQPKQIALIFQRLNIDLIEHILCFLHCFTDRVECSKVNKLLFDIHYRNVNPYTDTTIPIQSKNLYVMEYVSCESLLPSVIYLSYNHSMCPLESEPQRKLFASRFVLDGPYFILPSIGKLVLNLWRRDLKYQIYTLEYYEGVIHRLASRLQSLEIIEFNFVNYFSTSLITVSKSDGIYEQVIQRIFKSLHLFTSSRLKIVSFTTHLPRSCMILHTNISHLSPNIQCIVSSPVSTYIAHPELGRDTDEILVAQIAQYQKWTENPHITAVISTDYNPCAISNGLIIQSEGNMLPWRTIVYGTLTKKLLILLKQTPNVKALCVTYPIQYMNDIELRSMPCFNSLQRISINGQVKLSHFEWLPNLVHLRCACMLFELIQDSESTSTSATVFPSLKTLDILSIVVVEEEEPSFSWRFLRTYLRRTQWTRSETVNVTIQAIIHRTYYRNFPSCTGCLLVRESGVDIGINFCRSYTVTEVGGRTDDENMLEMYTKDIDSIFTLSPCCLSWYFKPGTVHTNHHQFAQDEIATSIPLKSDEQVSNCRFYCPAPHIIENDDDDDDDDDSVISMESTGGDGQEEVVVDWTGDD